MQNFDWVKFNGECKQVIKEVRERFMDLANEIVDDDNSHYVEQMQEKQEKFTQEFADALIKDGSQEVFREDWLSRGVQAAEPSDATHLIAQVDADEQILSSVFDALLEVVHEHQTEDIGLKGITRKI